MPQIKPDIETFARIKLTIILLSLGLFFLAITPALAEDINDLLPVFHTQISPNDSGTIFLPGDCALYGNWDGLTSTCALTQDISESVEITADDITLDCDNHSITGTGSGYGIYLNTREGVIIKNCNVSNFSAGISLEFSINNDIIGNTSSNNGLFGLYLTESSDNNITDNQISNNGWIGIYLWPGVIPGSPSNNHIIENTISNNNYGIILEFAFDNFVYHNNFINNPNQAFIVAGGTGNLFDNDYPEGGNYWSDYSGVDLYSGPNQNEPGADGIGDTFHTFPGGQDRYPFMEESGWEEIMEVPLYTQIISPYPSEVLTDAWDDLKYGTGNYGNCFDTELNYSAIRNCGCAITSEVMILRFYGIIVDTDNNDVNPGSINAWFSKNNGYQSNGNIKWGKIDEYSKDPQTGITRLQFVKPIAFQDNATLDFYLGISHPTILYERMPTDHFIVADGKSGSSYTIKDPVWYETKYLAQAFGPHVYNYNNSFEGLRIFSPTITIKKGIIYMHLASPAELLITDPLGRRLGKDPVSNISYNEIPDSSYYLEGIGNPLIEIPIPAQKSKNIWTSGAIEGNYDIKVIGTNSGTYTLDFLAYNEVGESTGETFEGVTDQGVISNYSLNYSTDPEEPVEIEQVITLEDITEDVKISYDLGWITKKWVKAILIAKLRIAQRLEQRGGERLEYLFLKLFIKEVKFFHKKGYINDQARELLINDAQYIIGHL